jgi:hypothetical protein
MGKPAVRMTARSRDRARGDVQVPPPASESCWFASRRVVEGASTGGSARCCVPLRLSWRPCTRATRTRVSYLPRRRGKDLADIIFNARAPQWELGESAFDDNYKFFLWEVQGDSDRVWRGLRRLEHVSISLLDNANPQQVFESLNSTGAPLTKL